MPFILGTNSIKDTGYNVDNSLRFNDGSSDYLNRTPSSASNRKTWTFSSWFKISGGSSSRFFTAQTDGNNIVDFSVETNGTLYLGIYEGGSWKELVPNRLFRDFSSWYHFVIACDTTQSTASNRLKLYVNGEQITSFATEVYASQDYDTAINNNVVHRIGAYVNNGLTFDGYMAEVCFIDGSQLAADSFGEFDSDSPTIWKPIDVSGLTFGTNGFYLEFKQAGTSANASGLGADTSGNTHHFTVNNLTAVDQSTDTCTNNFNIMNRLYAWTYDMSFSDGNLSCSGTQNQWQGAIGSMGINTGKWYYEVKFTSATDVGAFYIGFGGLDDFLPGSPGFRNAVAFYNDDGGEVNVADTSNTAVTTADYGTFANGDIMGVALDYDNELITIYKNGSAIVTNFDYGATTYPSTIKDGKTISPVAGHYGSGSISFNFGSPSFAISSSNADGNGFGNFEYAVPSGYFALCTKNLAEFG